MSLSDNSSLLLPLPVQQGRWEIDKSNPLTEVEFPQTVRVIVLEKNFCHQGAQISAKASGLLLKQMQC